MHIRESNLMMSAVVVQLKSPHALLLALSCFYLCFFDTDAGAAGDARVHADDHSACTSDNDAAGDAAHTCR